jgi:hypothetical protein
MWTAENRHRYDRDKLRYPSDLTDAEWLNRPYIFNTHSRGADGRRARRAAGGGWQASGQRMAAGCD